MLMLLLMLIPSGEPWGASQGNQGRAARGTGGPPGGPVEVLGFGEGGGRVQSEEWMAYLEPVHCQTGNINNWLENSHVTHMNVAIMLQKMPHMCRRLCLPHGT